MISFYVKGPSGELVQMTCEEAAHEIEGLRRVTQQQAMTIELMRAQRDRAQAEAKRLREAVEWKKLSRTHPPESYQ